MNREMPLQDFLPRGVFLPFTLSVSVVRHLLVWLLDANFGPVYFYLKQLGGHPSVWLRIPAWPWPRSSWDGVVDIWLQHGSCSSPALQGHSPAFVRSPRWTARGCAVLGDSPCAAAADGAVRVVIQIIGRSRSSARSM